MICIEENDVGQFQAPVALHINLVRAVDQNVRHRRIGEQWFDRPQTHDFVLNLSNDVLAFD